MVRKRNRRYYESEDSGSDGAARSPVNEEPPPKKYSLRQKRRTIFTEDFEYDFEEDGEANKKHPSDEDFTIEDENSDEPEPSQVSVQQISLPVGGLMMKNDLAVNRTCADNGLIDFEDMIRADIVVNKNKIDYDKLIGTTEINLQSLGNTMTEISVHSVGKRVRGAVAKRTVNYRDITLEPQDPIDYDNLIEKSEITIQPATNNVDEKVQSVKRKVPKKRGRKPKVKPPQEIENGHSIFQHFLDPIMDATMNTDTNSSDDLPLAVMMRRNTENVEGTNEENVEVTCQPEDQPETPEVTQNAQIPVSPETENGISNVQNNCDNFSNQETESNCDEILIEAKTEILDPEDVNDAKVSDDDDVILIEAKRDIIVLDD